MTRSLLVLALSGLAACAVVPAEAPGCSGPRRPANPYGSVLVPGGAPAPPPVPAPAAPGPACGGPRP